MILRVWQRGDSGGSGSCLTVSPTRSCQQCSLLPWLALWLLAALPHCLLRSLTPWLFWCLQGCGCECLKTKCKNPAASNACVLRLPASVPLCMRTWPVCLPVCPSGRRCSWLYACPNPITSGKDSTRNQMHLRTRMRALQTHHVLFGAGIARQRSTSSEKRR